MTYDEAFDLDQIDRQSFEDWDGFYECYYGRLVPNSPTAFCDGCGIPLLPTESRDEGLMSLCPSCDREYSSWVMGATRCCSICDGIGHGYPGGGPCPLEDRGYDTDGVWQ